MTYSPLPYQLMFDGIQGDSEQGECARCHAFISREWLAHMMPFLPRIYIGPSCTKITYALLAQKFTYALLAQKLHTPFLR